MRGVSIHMTEERMTATLTIQATVQDVFNVLADPSTHQAIDGTGWVREPLDGKPLAGVGQVFRMRMFHENHPDKVLTTPISSSVGGSGAMT